MDRSKKAQPPPRSANPFRGDEVCLTPSKSIELLAAHRTPSPANTSTATVTPPLVRFQIRSVATMDSRTLVSAGRTDLVPVRILNTSEQTQNLGAQTVVALAKAVNSFEELELRQADSESTEITQSKSTRNITRSTERTMRA